MRQQSHLDACHELLSAIVVLVSNGKVIMFDVRVGSEARWEWPAPLVGKNACAVWVEDGVADISEFLAVQRSLGDLDNASRWLVGARWAGSDKVPLVDMLMDLLLAGPISQPFFMMLLVGLGLHFHEFVQQAPFEGDSGSGRFSVLVGQDDDMSIYQEGRFLATHYTAARQALVDLGAYSHFSVATDKARVGGLGLSSSFFAFANGLSIEAFHQVVDESCVQVRSICVDVMAPLSPCILMRVCAWRCIPTAGIRWA